MRRLLASTLIVGLSLGLAGCGEKSKVEDKTTIEGPGGTTEIKNTKEVKESGSNPPSAATAEPPAK